MFIMDEEVTDVKSSPITTQYLITYDDLNEESTYFLEKEYMNNEKTVEINLSGKKIIEYETVFKDFHQSDRLLEICDKDDFTLPEFPLDQLEPLVLSSNTMVLSNEILPSITQVISTDSAIEYKSEENSHIETNNPTYQMKVDSSNIDNSSNEHPSCAFVLDVPHKQNECHRTQNVNVKHNNTFSTREKRNKLSVNNKKITINTNNVNKRTENSNGKDNHVMTVVAISTNKVSNMTQIVINTGVDEQIYQGKTSDLVQASSNLSTSSNKDSSVDWNSQLCNVNSSCNKGHDLLMSKTLEDLGITDDKLQPCTITENGKIWLCPRKDCVRKFTRLHAFKCHLLTHYGVRPFKCNFDGCTWSFFSEFKLKRHKETHLKKKDFICKIADCKRRFTTIYNLWSHEKLHSRPNKIICHVPECEEKFQTKRALEFHMKSHDQSHAPYVCRHEGCDKRYYSNNALTSHQRCHSYKETDIKCSWINCGKIFDKPCRLKAHMRSHTGLKPYSCNFQDCQWSFSSSSKLKRHQKKHTNDRKFICDIESCGKAFMRSEHLKEHKLTHSQARFFCCDLCGSKFSAKSSLYVHIKKLHKKDSLKSSSEHIIAEEKQLKTNPSTTALKSHNQNTVYRDNKSEDETDYVLYMNKMIMLPTPCDTNNVNNISDPVKYDNIIIMEDDSSTNSFNQKNLSSIQSGINKNDLGSARTGLTRSDVLNLKINAFANSVYPVMETNSETTDDILGSTDISEELLLTDNLSSLYYEDGIESNECQILLLNTDASENINNVKDVD